QCRNEFSDETGGLFGVGREFVISIGLKLRGLVAEGTFNTFAELQFSSGSSSLQVWKPSRPRSSPFATKSCSCSILFVRSSTARGLDRARSDLARAIECGKSVAHVPWPDKKTAENRQRGHPPASLGPPTLIAPRRRDRTKDRLSQPQAQQPVDRLQRPS